METVGISEFREPVDDRSAGIPQAQHLGTLVEGLPHRIVDRLSQDLVFQRACHLDYLRVTAGNEKTEVREGGLVHGLVGLPDEIRQDMALQVIHHHHGDVQRKGQRLGEGGTDQERAQQARPPGEGNRRKFFRLHHGLAQRLRDDRDDILLVGTGSQFRYHPAEVLVDLLGGDDIR